MVAFELQCSLVDEVFSRSTMACLIFFYISWNVLNTAVKPENLGVTLTCFASVVDFLSQIDVDRFLMQTHTYTHLS